MKFTPSDNTNLKTALNACRLAGIDVAAITDGLIRGLSDSQNAAVFSEIELSFGNDVQLGITRLSELEKRLSLFGDGATIECDLTDDKKVKKLSVKSNGGKIEFRCTDIKMLKGKYPTANSDEASAVITFSKTEVSLISRGVKTLGAAQITVQVKRDGQVHIESVDTDNDRFELDLIAPAEFIEDAIPSVYSYATGSSGVFLSLLENTVKDADSTQVTLMKAGNIEITVNGYRILAIPRID